MSKDIPLVFAMNCNSDDVILALEPALSDCRNILEHSEFLLRDLGGEDVPLHSRDTLVKTVEARYGIELHARGDTKLGNLLENRGFESLTQFLKAYRGDLPTMHVSAASISVFTSKIWPK